MHVHLDVQGGISGDMFLACILDARADLEAPLQRAIGLLDLPDGPTVECVPAFDQGLRGSRVAVHVAQPDPHGHRAWSDIRALLEGSALPAPVVARALAIFGLLAVAEAEVHGGAAEDVEFHEVGAVDSIVDIVGAAFLIDALGADSWSASSLPLGSGRIRSAHGVLPVPAPATALLLEGFVTFDDGIGGERVTPTGAAILRHLGCDQDPQRLPRRLTRTGIGFGTRTLPGMSNCLRALLLENPESPSPHRELAVFEFEVDDQTPEDLAAGLDRLRSVTGVHDVVQIAAHGKKGRIAAHVQMIVSTDHVEAVARACFAETTTIGLRYRMVRSIALARDMRDATVEGHALRVKVVTRPDGTRTAKADLDGVVGAGGHAIRTTLRRAAEARVLDPSEGLDDA